VQSALSKVILSTLQGAANKKVTCGLWSTGHPIELIVSGHSSTGHSNLILAFRQGFGELKTEQLGGHSQEQQRHRQTPIDDDSSTLYGVMAMVS